MQAIHVAFDHLIVRSFCPLLSCQPETRVWEEIARIFSSVTQSLPVSGLSACSVYTLHPYGVHSHPACTGKSYKLQTAACLVHACNVGLGRLAVPSIDYVGLHCKCFVPLSSSATINTITLPISPPKRFRWRMQTTRVTH